MNSIAAFIDDPAFLVGLPVIVVIALVLGYLTTIVGKVRLLWATLTWLAFLGVVFATMVGGGRTLEFNEFNMEYLTSCVWWGGATLDAQLVLNLVLYAPSAFCLTMLLRRPTRALVIGIAAVLVVEFFQTVMNRGVCEGTDVALNALGVLVGVGVAVMVIRRTHDGAVSTYR
jgi:glycopeptide antibiotics resistance protein